jgi:hypothetical protein
MVDCFDRIAVQMTEIALEPVHQLRQRTMLSAVSLRTPSGGRRFLVTIAKRFPDGEREAPRYTWRVEEISAVGDVLADGITAASKTSKDFAQPEDAYWAAMDALAAATKER